MSVIISSVEKGSPAARAGIKGGETLISINDNEIIDVLDYRFYQNETKLSVEILKTNGKRKRFKIKKAEYKELGLLFDTYLMDAQRSCKNNCIFCFIDQLPKGMRDSLYFKDDDSRLSFLFGNYITLTNLTQHEINRIINMHISPVNISVHTTNPELRVKMMKNRFAGEVLGIIDKLDKAGIKMNCQLVLVPEYNDGKELERSISDLLGYKNIECVAAVPVGITKHREGLTPIKSFDKDSANEVINIIDRFGEESLKNTGRRKVFAADEFYLTGQRPIPNADYYEDFPQLENGVGMWALFKEEAEQALEESDRVICDTQISLVCGMAPAPLLQYVVDKATAKWHNLICRVYPIKNDFFGEKITVSGLVTGSDIINQLKGKPLGEKLLIPANMLRFERDMFLDNVTVTQLENELGVKVVITEGDGADFIEKLGGGI